MSQHLCLSNSPSCSGVRPCSACFAFLLRGHVEGQMVWPSGGVIPRAMFLAGPPFNADPHLAVHFMQAYGQAMKDGAIFITQLANANQAYVAQQQQAAQSHSREPQTADRFQGMNEQEYLLMFHDQIVESLKTMPDATKQRMIEGVANQTLEGWDMLSEEERSILRVLFLPPTQAENPEDAPLPSNESAQKVVDAMRAGTLGPHTLAPPEPPPPQTPVAAAAAVTPQPQVPSQAPVAASPAPATNANNGTSDTTGAPAQIAVASTTET